MGLAKHEIPKAGRYALAPGYGRIHMEHGSIYWQVLLGDNEIDIISRRELADECERLTKDRSRSPRAIQEHVKTFPSVATRCGKWPCVLRTAPDIDGFWCTGPKL